MAKQQSRISQIAQNLKDMSCQVNNLWNEGNYLDICNISSELMPLLQSLIQEMNKVGSQYRGVTEVHKMIAYIVTSSLLMGNDEVLDEWCSDGYHDIIKFVFEDETAGAWLLESLQKLNMDLTRSKMIQKILPEKYHSAFDFSKFDIAEADYSVDESIIQRKENEWNQFICRCEEIGVLDLRSVILNFPKNYFEEEMRDGFLISRHMKSCWAANLEVLHKVDILCQALDIPYYVDWGTMLGTVRHHGFIPWDDDIDIGVLRKDYDKLKYAIQNCQNELQFFDNYNDDDWGAHASKIVYSLSFLTNRHDIKRYHGFSFFASVDVFVIDCVPRDKDLEKEQYDIIRLISEIVHIRADMEQCREDDNQYRYWQRLVDSGIETLKRMCHVEFEQENPTNQELFILKDEVLSLYSEEQSDYYTVPHRLANGQEYYIPKEVFANRIRMPFECIEVNIPSGYDFILTKNYGDNYMTPINRGGGHDYPFYGSLIDAMVESRKKSSREETLEYIKNISYGYYEKFLNQTNETRLQLDESFYAEEQVGDVITTEDTKRIRAAELEVLEEIKRICRKKKLKYFAIGNTAESARKCGDFAPGEDGIHIGMPRADYVTFMNCLGEELDSWFDYESIYQNDGHDDMRSYILSDAFMVRDEDYLERFHGCSEIVAIDVSPIDMVDPDEEKDRVRMELFGAMIRTATICPETPPYSEEILSLVDEWSDKVKIEFDKEGNLSRDFLRAADGVASSYDGVGEYVRVTPDLQVGLCTVMSAESIVDGEEISFGPTTIIVPSRV